MGSQRQPSQKFGIFMLSERQEESLYQWEERRVVSKATSKSKIKKSEVKYYYKVW